MKGLKGVELTNHLYRMPSQGCLQHHKPTWPSAYLIKHNLVYLLTALQYSSQKQAYATTILER
jgi:hypothetical protein